MPLWFIVILIGAVLAFAGVPYSGLIVLIGVVLFIIWLWQHYGNRV
jgi:hypothetical protein